MIKINATVRLARDAEMRFTSSGAAVLSFRAASNPRRKNEETGRWEDVRDKTTWLTCDLWGDTAQAAYDTGTLRKGELVDVVGSLYTDTYVTRDGEERKDLKVKVESVVAKFADSTPTVPSTGYSNAQSEPDPWSTGGGGF